MTLSRRLSQLESLVMGSGETPKPVLVNFIDTDSTGTIISTGGLLMTYKANGDAETIRLTADQVNTYTAKA